MPHIVLEYSNNVVLPQKAEILLERVHQLLVNKLPTQIENCKSRTRVCDTFVVGDGRSDHAFVHMSIKILAGRSEEHKAFIAQELLDMMDDFFLTGQTLPGLHLSVEIEDLDQGYCKKTSGS